MTVQSQDNQSPAEAKVSDKELNFRALEQKYKQQLELVERKAQEAERKVQELEQRKAALQDEDEDDSEPYVDKKRLSKTLNRFGQSTKSDIQNAMESAKAAAKEELKQELWLDQNPDFHDILENNAEKLYQANPELAKSILKMPEGFERNKLAYQNIKALGLHKPPEKQSSIQDKIDANRRSPYYQPSGVGTAPYSNGGDFSPSGQKNSYDQMQALKNRLRL